MTTLYDFTVKNIKGEAWNLADLKGKVVLVVNVASKCGFTKQYAGLEELYQKYKDRDFVIVGCPCNQFGGQEPGSEEEIQNFCSLNWSVTFPLTSKVEVNGDNEAPLWKWMKESQPGILGLKRVKWNFEKFLIDREGKVVKRYASTTEPKSIAEEVEKHL
ncbi:glutathione peroxidase [Rhizopus microsporus var. microsporus]|uniref:Glutathione peroxidase n=2 Tax=Rhizopus microsporus TaxID=58291 RepID=A0A2G4SXP7_RHIZD|nr:glutathione peroxidase [Rhizopus microsporus ATCC 52813]ORE02651.1 glutathione peroxidase [Rhizopus microsporus var. microsporus]PHZ13522.1 glutathione peroxidase [Rhizopus microsporus ATCC 52813]